LNKKSTSIREDITTLLGRVRGTEYLGGFTGSFAESSAVPATAQTPTSIAASKTSSKDAI